MPSDILQSWQAAASFTITLANLGNGSGRQSTMITNASPSYPRAKITAKITTGTTPTAGTTVDFYLLRSNGTIRTDSAGASDAALTVVNAQPIGSIYVPTNTTNAVLIGDFMMDDLGPSWGIAVVNRSGVALYNNAVNNNSITYEYTDMQASAYT
jgi:hypothetical protein